MPADITGTEILEEAGDGHRRMQFVKGPIFANVILADEINRTPPKTQAALLEAMQEHQVTAAGVRYPLEEPFFVLATQNPIEMEGTYPLPEAQLDRFMFNVVIDYLPEDDEVAVVEADHVAPARADRAAVHRRGRAAVSRGGAARADRRGRRPLRRAPGRRQPARPAGLARLRQRVGELGRRPARRRSTWCWAPRPGPCSPAAPTSRLDDIRALVHPTFRHRILVSYRAEAEGRDASRRSIDRLLETVKGPRPADASDPAHSTSRSRHQPRGDMRGVPQCLVHRPARADADQEPAAARQGRRRGFLERPAPQPVSRLLGRVHRVPPVHARRRPALSRLAALRPHRPLLHQAVRGRDEPALLPAGRSEPLDGLRLARLHQGRLRPHGGRDAGLLSVARSATRSAWSRSTRRSATTCPRAIGPGICTA